MNPRIAMTVNTGLSARVLGVVGIGLFLAACAPAARPAESAAIPAPYVPTTSSVPLPSEVGWARDRRVDLVLR